MRFFLGVFPPPEVKEAIERLAVRLQRLPGLAPGRTGPRWVRAEQWHVTLRFLGERTADLAARLAETGRAAVAGLSRFEIELGGLGGFPTPRRARVLWLGVQRGGEELEALAAAVESAVGRVGVEPDERGFHPHVTLARAGRGHLRVPGIETEIPPLLVENVRLVHSLARHGGGYDEVDSWPLGR